MAGIRLGARQLGLAPLLVTAKLLEGIDDCLKEALAGDLMSLPLTLAVLDGMLVKVAGQTAVIPLSAVVETIRSLAPQEGESGLDVFGKLMGGLASLTASNSGYVFPGATKYVSGVTITPAPTPAGQVVVMRQR